MISSATYRKLFIVYTSNMIQSTEPLSNLRYSSQENHTPDNAHKVPKIHYRLRTNTADKVSAGIRELHYSEQTAPQATVRREYPCNNTGTNTVAASNYL